MREQPKISVDRLRACLTERYDLVPVFLEYLPLGLDYRAGVYRVESAQGAVYLLKVKAGTLYEPGCLLPASLSEQGITAVVAPVPTNEGKLWTKVENWTVIVYPFIAGDTSWTGMTDEQWREVGGVFRRIHQAALPADPGALRIETFDPSDYMRQTRTLEAHFAAREPASDSPSQHALRSAWLAQQGTIHQVLAALEKLAPLLRERALPAVICHADLHPANLLRARADGRVFVIDWDEVMLAPKERDFLFIREEPSDSPTLPGTPAFFQGYGPLEIDWIALTYYRYERVIQDLLACAQEVFERDDLGEETKQDSASLFRSILAEGGEIEAATQASMRLPADLALPTRMIAGIEKELAGRERQEAP